MVLRLLDSVVQISNYSIIDFNDVGSSLLDEIEKMRESDEAVRQIRSFNLIDLLGNDINRRYLLFAFDGKIEVDNFILSTSFIEYNSSFYSGFTKGAFVYSNFINPARRIDVNLKIVGLILRRVAWLKLGRPNLYAVILAKSDDRKPNLNIMKSCYTNPLSSSPDVTIEYEIDNYNNSGMVLQVIKRNPDVEMNTLDKNLFDLLSNLE